MASLFAPVMACHHWSSVWASDEVEARLSVRAARTITFFINNPPAQSGLKVTFGREPLGREPEHCGRLAFSAGRTARYRWFWRSGRHGGGRAGLSGFCGALL